MPLQHLGFLMMDFAVANSNDQKTFLLSQIQMIKKLFYPPLLSIWAANFHRVSALHFEEQRRYFHLICTLTRLLWTSSVNGLKQVKVFCPRPKNLIEIEKYLKMVMKLINRMNSVLYGSIWLCDIFNARDDKQCWSKCSQRSDAKWIKINTSDFRTNFTGHIWRKCVQ